GLVYLSQRLRDQLGDDGSLLQLCQAASLPGAFHKVIGMPDIHSGFGLPIGGVLATDAKRGVVSAGAVGMDINCGVRLLRTAIPAKELSVSTLRALIKAIENRVPSGIGKTTKYTAFRQANINNVLINGAQAIVDEGYGEPLDIEHTEERGRLLGADPSALPKGALARTSQLSTLGGGNHFIELGVVEKTYNPLAETAFKLAAGNLTVMIHTGSRGLGHQICTQFSELMIKAAPALGVNLPSKGLAAVPITSKEGRAYLSAMACAVNYAFANRQLIAFGVREAFIEVLGRDALRGELSQVYDIAHNIAKFENHFGQRLLVHRKGATRALPAGHSQNP
ncbi:MAG: RtcB family protein, partial [bacterium]|nr:RtcB family protein [bacterium]